MGGTYPTYPQPIIKAPTGLNWFLEIDGGGALISGGTTIDAPTGARRLQLTTPGRAKAFELGLDGSNPPLITSTEKDASFGGFVDLFVFGGDGREFAVQSSDAGVLSVKDLNSSAQVPVSQSVPLLKAPGGVSWRFSVSDQGVLTHTEDFSTLSFNRALLKSLDNSTVFEITVDDDGILTVSNDNTQVTDTDVHTIELISPNETRYGLQVSADGVLTLLDFSQRGAGRDLWTLVMARSEKVLFVVDTRFRNPFKGRWGA